MDIHWLFVALLGWAALDGWVAAAGRGNAWAAAGALGSGEQALTLLRSVGTGLQGAVLAATSLILVFGCVLLHEIGHSLHAQALGIPVRRILLLPVGGLAQLARLPERPVDELRVAVAGPLANIGLALILGALATLGMLAGTPEASPREALRFAVLAASPGLWASTTPLSILFYLAFANVAIALFNLMPAFPMDGGRVLRSVLAMGLRRRTATRVVTGLGWLVGIALALGGLGLWRFWGMPATLAFMAMGALTIMGASVEQAMENSRTTLRTIPVRRAVRQPTWILSPTDRIRPGLVDAAFSLGRSVVPVVVSERLVGLLARSDLAAALRRTDVHTVAHVMRTQFPYVRADEDLWHAQQLLAGTELGALPVLEGDTLFGMLNPADIRAARSAQPVSHPPGAKPVFISGGDPTP